MLPAETSPATRPRCCGRGRVEAPRAARQAARRVSPVRALRESPDHGGLSNDARPSLRRQDRRGRPQGTRRAEPAVSRRQERPPARKKPPAQRQDSGREKGGGLGLSKFPGVQCRRQPGGLLSDRRRARSRPIARPSRRLAPRPRHLSAIPVCGEREGDGRASDGTRPRGGRRGRDRRVSLTEART